MKTLNEYIERQLENPEFAAAWREGEAGTPVIDDSPLVMECEVVDNYETETFDNFICKINATHVEEDCLNENIQDAAKALAALPVPQDD